MKMKPAICGGRPVRGKFLVFGRPHILQIDIDEVVDTLKSGWLSRGPKTERFEKAFARYAGCRYAIGLNSCTSGLYLALEAAGIGRGAEVITSPITFAATANVIVQRGAKPVFADIDPLTLNITPKEIKKRITRRTKAIMPVHMAGRPCQMNEIMAIAERRRLLVIEDAAHAVEARYKGRKVGNIGDMTAFSFYATKNIATGEGGMVTTNNAEWARKIKLLSLHGLSKSAWSRYTEKGFRPYDILVPGYKFNMMDIQASLGLHQLARIGTNLKARERCRRMYDNAFDDVPEITILKDDKRIRHARHLYVILINPERLKIDRNRFVMALKAENIGSGIHFSAVHLSAYYKKAFGYKKGMLPHAEYASERVLSLPLASNLTEKDVGDVIRAVKKITGHYGR